MNILKCVFYSLSWLVLILAVALLVSPLLWAQGAAVSGMGHSFEWLSTTISERGILIGLLAVFVGGLALNLTPCVYPMIPVTLAFFSAQASGKTKRTVSLAIVYVLGISLSYAVLGFVAARTGALLGSWLRQPIVLMGVAAVVVALSLGMFGLYELRPPMWVMRRLGRTNAGFPGAFIMGLVVGIIAAPCVGPFIIGLMLLVGQLASAGKGFLIFFIMGLGMGLPYIVLALAANRVSRLPRAGTWMLWIKKLLGIVLLGLALFLMNPLLPDAIVWVAIAVLLLWAGLYLGWLERSAAKGIVFQRIRRAVGIVLVCAAVVFVWPKPQAAASVEWVPYSEKAFEQARSKERPILVDVYADWCAPCVEMDHFTFRNPDVVKALGAITTLRIDATLDISKESEELLSRHNVVGVPTMLFFDRQGTERPELRLTGFVGSADFLDRLAQIQ